MKQIFAILLAVDIFYALVVSQSFAQVHENVPHSYPNICELSNVNCPYERKIIIAEVTKYSAIETCGETCVTASGVHPGPNRTLACPRSIQLGTRVNIDGRWYTCEDRLNLRYDSRFDIYAGASQSDYEEALKWGVKKLPVMILN